jgi:hypothetical protein
MTRAMDSLLSTQLDAPQVTFATFAELEFDFPLRLWSGYGSIVWQDVEWLGNGWLRPIKAINENADLTAAGVQVELGGAASEAIAMILRSAIHARQCRIYIGAMWDLGFLGNPLLVFAGRFSTAEFNDTGTESTIALQYESKLITLRNSSDLKFTDAAQQDIYPGDKGFEYVQQMANWTGYWVRPEATPKNETAIKTIKTQPTTKPRARK